MKTLLALVLAGFVIPSYAEYVEIEPRWGTIMYDTNRVQYTLPKCKQSKVKSLSVKKKDGSYVIKLECEPVPGEVNIPNPDF